MPGNFLAVGSVGNGGADVSDDARLIEEALAGDSSSFGQLVGMYQDRLFNTMVHSIGSREEAEDVVQDAFVQAYLKLATFKGNSGFYTWLYRIAFNVRISRRRRKRPEVSIDAAREATGQDPAGFVDPPSENLERAERVAQVQAALAQLSEEYRTVLVLREMEGCCYETISQLLDLPVGTVRSRLHRARSQLREVLRGVLQEHS
jgi:RNA polymerase sigma-70 factor (ECF subfamily)